MFSFLRDRFQGKIPLLMKRSGSWARIRREHIAKNPLCAVCGGKDKVEVHHKKPFHLHPELELDPQNLITLCESWKNGICCHLLVGHLGSYKSFNVHVEDDAALLNQKISKRPTEAE